jgi:hypothetical protein
MDVKKKQQALIEFLVLEGYEGDNIAPAFKMRTVEMNIMELRCSVG